MKRRKDGVHRANNKQKEHELQRNTSEQLHCAVCRVTWSARTGSLDTHRRGRKHRDNVVSDALYGMPTSCLPLRFDGVSLPHSALPVPLAHRARAIWALLTQSPASLVALAGVDCYQSVLDLLLPERLACAGVRLHVAPTVAACAHVRDGTWRADVRSPAGFAFACSLLEEGTQPPNYASRHLGGDGAGARFAAVELTLGPYNAQESPHALPFSLAFVHSLPLLGRALQEGLAAPLVSIRLRHFAVQSGADSQSCTRALTRLLAVLGSALGCPRGLRATRRLEISLPAELIHPEYEPLLRAAEEASWQRRIQAVLLGTHTRAGANSPLRLLPTPVLELICARMRECGRTAVSLRPWDPMIITSSPLALVATQREMAEQSHVAYDERSGKLHLARAVDGTPIGPSEDIAWMLASGFVGS